MIVNEISLVIQNKNDINADKKVNELLIEMRTYESATARK